MPLSAKGAAKVASGPLKPDATAGLGALPGTIFGLMFPGLPLIGGSVPRSWAEAIETPQCTPTVSAASAAIPARPRAPHVNLVLLMSSPGVFIKNERDQRPSFPAAVG